MTKQGLRCAFVLLLLLLLSDRTLAQDLAVAQEAAPSGTRTRSLVYPVLQTKGAPPPELHLDAGGAPLTLFFPDLSLDARLEVHLLSAPERVELRVAEKTAYLLALPHAQRNTEPIVLTLTLENGRPLTFGVVLVSADARSDALVEVRLPGERERSQCPAKLVASSDLLASCHERAGRSGVERVARLVARTDPGEVAATVKHIGWRNKAHHLFVEVIDVLHLGTRAFVRIRVENRDPTGPAWRPGELRVQTDDPIEPRRLAIEVAQSVEAIAPRETMMIVVAFETPQLPAGIHLRVVIPEAGGVRHLIASGL